jgi:GTP cyclohydrolase II
MIHVNQIVERLQCNLTWCSVPLQSFPDAHWKLASTQGHRIFWFQHSRPSTTHFILRIHSECFTGDVLGSALCDCGNQLQKALEIISTNKLCCNGAIIFPDGHEGRGIGLEEKIKAYTLQRQQHLNTFEANLALGHAEDARSFDDVPLLLLSHMNIRPESTTIVLLTENTDKQKCLLEAGYRVMCQPLHTPLNKHNAKYVQDKRNRFVDKQAPVALQLTSEQQELVRKNLDVCFVCSKWHASYVNVLTEEIRRTLCHEYSVDPIHVETIYAPGSFEIPFFIQQHAKQTSRTTVYIAVGILVKGETDHYDLVAQETIASLSRIITNDGICIVNSVLACHSMQQVQQRCDPESDACVAEHLASAAIQYGIVKLNTSI